MVQTQLQWDDAMTPLRASPLRSMRLPLPQTATHTLNALLWIVGAIRPATRVPVTAQYHPPLICKIQCRHLVQLCDSCLPVPTTPHVPPQHLHHQRRNSDIIAIPVHRSGSATQHLNASFFTGGSLPTRPRRIQRHPEPLQAVPECVPQPLRFSVSTLACHDFINPLQEYNYSEQCSHQNHWQGFTNREIMLIGRSSEIAKSR